MYVSDERTNRLYMFRFVDDQLEAEPAHTRDTLANPDDVRPRQLAGPIHVHPSGNAVYVVNRSDHAVDVGGRRVFGGGENNIAVYAIDPVTGEPFLIQHADTRSFHVRTFACDPAVVDWSHYVQQVHLPSIINHARVKVTPDRSDPDARQNRLRGRVLAPERHLAAFNTWIDGYYDLDAERAVNLTFGAVGSYRWQQGRSWMAIRDMDIAAEIIGVSPLRAKLSAFAVSSFFVGIAGALFFAVYLGAIEVGEAFGIDKSFLVLFIIIIGGLGSILGSFLGAAFIVLLPIFLSNAPATIGFPMHVDLVTHLEFMIFGGLIIFFLIVEPHGLARLWAIGKEKLSDKGVSSADKRVAPLRNQTNLDRDVIIHHLIGHFRARYGLRESQITPKESEDADERARIDALDRLLSSLRAQLHGLPASRMVDALEQFIALDVPFLVDQRNARVAQLQALLARSDVTVAEQFRNVLQAWQEERDYGSTIEAYTGLLEINGVNREVNFLRVGRVALVYQTPDGGLSGAWDQRTRQWITLGGDYQNAIREGLRVARTGTPELLLVPVPAPEEG